jgi:uncharacterized membrane protein YfcA
MRQRELGCSIEPSSGGAQILLTNANAATFQIPAVLFFATLIRSSFGFGEALFAVPILALLIPVRVAVPLAALVSITVALVVVVQDWQKVHARSAGSLLFATLFGIPLGLLLLKTVAEPVVKTVLAVVILAFAVYSLVNQKPRELKDDRLAWLFGFSAGVLGGAYSMNGPPLVMYGTLRRWSPVHFRATLQGYFLPASAVVVFGYWLTGLLTAAVGRYYLLSLPFVLVAIFIGRVINRRMESRRFTLLLHFALALIGIVLLLEAWRG